MKFLETLKALSPAKQLMLAGAMLAVILAVSLIARGVTREPMALLYAGLEPQVVGDVIKELERSGVPYEIRGEAVFIPQGKRDLVRIELASAGLPRQSVQGYELLDQVNGFSVTSEMYNAAYWRAKEGELTRTILAIPGVTSARVHIGANLRSGFARSQPQQTASVTLTSARDLTQSQAEAIQYLVALAVSGLKAEDVAVIDPSKGILAGPKASRMAEPMVAAEDHASAIEEKIMRLLDPRVGAGNARVSVSVDVSRERQRTSAVMFDPQSRVIRNRTTNDVNETNTGGAGGVTVASNLPQGAGGGAGGGSSTRNSTESIVFEINETRTEVETLPGQIQRISVAVLLNLQSLGIDPAAADAGAAQAQAAAEFERLIASAAGLNLERGDTISVELMPFQPIAAEELMTPPSLIDQLIERYFWSALQALLLGVVIIVLVFGVIRPMLMPRPGAAAADGPAPGAAGVAAGGGLSAAPVEADPFTYLQDYASERQDEAAALLQQWLNEDQQPAASPLARKVAVNE
ncbi:flagellar basal-body MS-ring/collar protein FliF [Hyphomonas sp.]|uniref:flagellar basal-body MS-ring/collar protein FliF n=1 Tax=Hyphomonas sp. TaxID=87 RepID=UPI00391CC919